MNVTLTDDQLDQVYELASERNNARSYDGTYHAGGLEAHVRGLKAEVAFGDVYGLSIDAQFRASGDGGIDFVADVFDKRTTIDVKASSYYDDPWLLVNVDRHHSADLFVLAGVDGRDVRFVGCAPHAAVFHADPVPGDYGHANWKLTHEQTAPLPDPKYVHPE